ncbi:hypothetical protein Bca4012_070920 [Brassica carinata]
MSSSSGIINGFVRSLHNLSSSRSNKNRVTKLFDVTNQINPTFPSPSLCFLADSSMPFFSCCTKASLCYSPGVVDRE